MIPLPTVPQKTAASLRPAARRNDRDGKMKGVTYRGTRNSHHSESKTKSVASMISQGEDWKSPEHTFACSPHQVNVTRWSLLSIQGPKHGKYVLYLSVCIALIARATAYLLMCYRWNPIHHRMGRFSCLLKVWDCEWVWLCFWHIRKNKLRDNLAASDWSQTCLTQIFVIAVKIYMTKPKCCEHVRTTARWRCLFKLLQCGELLLLLLSKTGQREQEARQPFRPNAPHFRDEHGELAKPYQFRVCPIPCSVHSFVGSDHLGWPCIRFVCEIYAVQI